MTVKLEAWLWQVGQGCVLPLVTHVVCPSWCLDTRPQALLCLPGLHSHHLPAAALDRPSAGLPWQQELHAGRSPGGAALGAGHLHCGVKKVLPARRHCGQPPRQALLQWHCLVRLKVQRPLALLPLARNRFPELPWTGAGTSCHGS